MFSLKLIGLIVLCLAPYWLSFLIRTFLSKSQLRKEVDKDGTIKYYNKEGKLHREDGPACEYYFGDKEWYISGIRHREDGPACEWAEGSKSWYINGQLHREDGPAIENDYGYKFWYINGKELTEQAFNDRKNIQKTPNVLT